MLKVELTNETVFGFGGPNLTFLGTTQDFESLSKKVVDLTTLENLNINIEDLGFVKIEESGKQIMLSSKPDSNKLCVFSENALLIQLDPKFWERIFKYFILMSWDLKTYYLNIDEDCLSDLELQQECNWICSSEF